MTQTNSPEHTLTIDGARIDSIAGFYAEINRVFMAQEDWQLGASLDALNDMLYGGYGAAQGNAPVRLRWLNAEHSRSRLDVAATRAHYLDKLARPDTFNHKHWLGTLHALEAGHGPTYFEQICQVIASHPRFTLELA
ncbi:ribonuclease inhibitor [Corticibacter populi]|uniref:Ribonuclease inhibitor n=1 Tax=Corticibacter populi TaxID=1550736 RepID=A0A3M6QRM3_9BURK|nr:barstar family protein [Corticibacter populi]RMX05697.1 ribonuclease inhibitor [Corticibacter populi]RZS31013.1 barstar (barnase inhibitor) [Corticibacter populi]